MWGAAGWVMQASNVVNGKQLDWRRAVRRSGCNATHMRDECLWRLAVGDLRGVLFVADGGVAAAFVVHEKK